MERISHAWDTLTLAGMRTSYATLLLKYNGLVEPDHEELIKKQICNAGNYHVYDIVGNEHEASENTLL